MARLKANPDYLLVPNEMIKLGKELALARGNQEALNSFEASWNNLDPRACWRHFQIGLISLNGDR